MPKRAYNEIRLGLRRTKGEKILLGNCKHIHFVGIGGSGMSAIAKILLEMGYQVSGSDLCETDMTHKLTQLGATVFAGHQADYISGADAIVISTAIPNTNPELCAAREKGIKIFHRADIVAAVMNRQASIAVAGAHGKTTTTSMIALMLERAGSDPTVIIGGEMNDIGGNAKLGAGKYLVAEADESDGSFLKYAPQVAVVTNIENDHMDHYKTMDNILQAFREFITHLPTDGLAVVCFDNAYLRDIVKTVDRPFISYAIEHEADYMAANIRTLGATTIYDVYFRGDLLGTIKLDVPGRHNVVNSLAALIVGLHTGLTFAVAAEGLAIFQGVKRRFQTKGRVAGVWVVDDYAHHPTEIITTLLAARQTNPKRLICVFQPHRYTRTQLLCQEFGKAFEPADLLILTDIYAAGEQPIPGISGETIQDAVKQQTQQRLTNIADYTKIARYLIEIVEKGDLVITMGAGNIYLAGEDLVEKLVENQGATK
jgi:UDP-N-acetylmuramate--alanine ligase